MTSNRFRGVLTALITPFSGDSVDEEAFVALVERQIAAGVHGLVPAGTTGEASTLSHDEHRRVVELCVKTAAGRVPVIAGAGSNSTREAIELTRHAKAVGADAALMVTGYYNRPNQEGLFRHFEAVSGAVDFPIVAYNIPGRAVVDLSHETMVRLSRLDHVIGVKDATGDVARASQQRLDCGGDWVMLSGDDSTGLGYVAQGGHGCISVTSNLAPAACAALYNAALEGDFATARAWQDRLIGLHKSLFLDASPAPAKFAMAQMGLCGAEVRLPLVVCSEAIKPAILAAMAAAGLAPGQS